MPSIETLEFQGCRLAWRIEGAGPPLLMIQGVGAYGTAPNPLLELLKKHYTCLSFDNRGIGASQPAGMRLTGPLDPVDSRSGQLILDKVCMRLRQWSGGLSLTVDQMAADALALMDHAGWASAHIVGHSLGGLIALEIALTAKTRVRSLTLLCTFARGADGTRTTPRLLWIGLRVRYGSRRMRRRAFMELVLPPGQGYPDELAQRLSGILGHDIADLPPISNRQLAAMGRHDVTRRLGELSGIPTLVISAENDPIARPSSGKAIATGIAGAKYIEVPGASHSFPILEPERCGDLVLEHLAGAERNRLRSATDSVS